MSLGDISLNIASLDATVSTNATAIGGGKMVDSGTNEVAGSFSNVGGVSVSAQNAGNNGMVDQNVNVQANLGAASPSSTGN